MTQDTNQPNRLEQTHWDLIMSFVARTARERGLDGDFHTGVSILQEFWHTFGDKAGLQKAEDVGTLQDLRAARTKQDADRTSLDSEISRLETLTRGAP